jgi:hypothetical protein
MGWKKVMVEKLTLFNEHGSPCNQCNGEYERDTPCNGEELEISLRDVVAMTVKERYW